MASVYQDRTSAELATLAEPMRSVAYGLVAACREAGWPVVVQALGGRRTAQQQAALYAQGRTAPGPVVTSTLQSRHLGGLAVDFDLYGYPRSAGMELWRYLGAWWKASGHRWGGDWGDYGHFEW